MKTTIKHFGIFLLLFNITLGSQAQPARKAIVNDSIVNGHWSHQGGNYNNFLQRAPIGWTCYQAGHGGLANDGNTYLGMDWNPYSGGDMIRKAATNGFNIIMHYGQGNIQDYGGADPASADFAAQHGCAVFTFLYANNSPRNYADYRDQPGSGIYGMGPTPAMTVSGGYYFSSQAETSYGPQSEFIDAVWDGGSNIVAHAYDDAQSWAHSATAARYARLQDLHPTWNVYDLRQALRQTCTFYAAGWRPDGGYGFPLISNRIGDNFVEVTLPQSLTNLDVGPPIQPSAQTSSDGAQITFNWYNFRQTGFASTVIKVGGVTIFDGDATNFVWSSTITNVATAEFFTKLSDGRTSRDTHLDSYTRIVLESHPPVAGNDTYNIIRNTVTNLNIFGNDTNYIGNNSDLELTSISNLSPLDSGTINVNPDGRTIHFVPANDWLGTATFNYTITDGIGSSQATATINMIPIPDDTPPIISNILDQQIDQGRSLDIPFNVSDKYTLPDDLKYLVTSSNGSIIYIGVDGNGTNRILHLASSLQLFGDATVTLQVLDRDLQSSEVSFHVNVIESTNIPSLNLPTISSNYFSFNIAGPSAHNYFVYSSVDLTNWTAIGSVTLDSSGMGAFTDNAINGLAYRFYKLYNGTNYSRTIGFERLVAKPGYTPIANQLDALTNTLNGLFHPMPDGTVLPNGTQILKQPTPGLSLLTTYTNSSGTWLPYGDATLSPGEGAFIWNPTTNPFIVTFAGTVREGKMTHFLMPNMNLISSYVPIPCKITSMADYQPKSGDSLYKWEFQTQQWVVVSYFDIEDSYPYPAGWYDGNGLLTEQSVDVGESFEALVMQSNIWTQTYSSAAGTIVPALTRNHLNSSSFGFNATGVAGGGWIVYSSVDLTNWTAVGGITLDSAGVGTFTDDSIGGLACRFYKLSNGLNYSRTIGFERLVAGPGYTTIANHFDSPTNTLNGLFNPMPDEAILPNGAQILKQPAPGSSLQVTYTNSDGTWLPDGNATLPPGEGAFAWNPTTNSFIVTFEGLVREGKMTHTLVTNMNLISSYVPTSGDITSALGYQPGMDDTFYKWNPQTQQWIVVMYYDETEAYPYPAGWYNGGTLAEPSVDVGESFYIAVAQPNIWMQTYWSSTGTIVPALTQSHLNTNSFEFDASGMANSIWSVYFSADLTNWTAAGNITLDSNGFGTFTDNTISGLTYRFYKLGNGTNYSRTIGFERLVAGPGYTAIANHFDEPTNTLNGLFNTMPDGTTLPNGTQILKQPASGSSLQVTYTNSSGVWLPNGDATLSPGEGAFIRNLTTNTFKVTFSGLVREGKMAHFLATNMNLIGSYAPIAGSITSVLGYQPNADDTFYKWNPQTQQWNVMMYYDEIEAYPYPAGWYDGDGMLAEPSVNVGEGFYIETARPNVWMQAYSSAAGSN